MTSCENELLKIKSLMFSMGITILGLAKRHISDDGRSLNMDKCDLLDLQSRLRLCQDMIDYALLLAKEEDKHARGTIGEPMGV